MQFLRDLRVQTGKEVPTVDVDSPEGQDKCRLYDIVRYPAILTVDNDGKLVASWVGEPLPRISEISYYLQEG